MTTSTLEKNIRISTSPAQIFAQRNQLGSFSDEAISHAAFIRCIE